MKSKFHLVKNYGKVINDYKIEEIALNPTYLTDDDLKSLKNQGFRVR